MTAANCCRLVYTVMIVVGDETVTRPSHNRGSAGQKMWPTTEMIGRQRIILLIYTSMDDICNVHKLYFSSSEQILWRRKRGRPKQRWMDCVNRDMRAIGKRNDEVHDRTGWRGIVSAAATSQLSGSG